MEKVTIEFHQNDGIDETLRAASLEWAGKNRGRRVVSAAITYAYPGRPGEGRTVGIEIVHELDRSYAHAD